MRNLVEETHYNTRWWGACYGRVIDEVLFDLPLPRIQAALQPFSVVEHTSTDLDAEGVVKLRRAGFWRADTQIPFKINLKPFAATALPERVARITIKSAADAPFEISAEALPTFKAERFWQLQGVTKAQVAQRFAFWCADLIATDPDHCLSLYDQDRLIGWFLGRRLSASTIELTLAMGHPNAPAMGGLLYEAAHHHFARQGARIGQASFSASNPNVLNIYAGLGAKFQAARHFWLWQSEASQLQSISA